MQVLSCGSDNQTKGGLTCVTKNSLCFIGRFYTTWAENSTLRMFALYVHGDILRRQRFLSIADFLK